MPSHCWSARFVDSEMYLRFHCSLPLTAPDALPLRPMPQNRPEQRFRLAVGSFIEEYNNRIEIITCKHPAETCSALHALTVGAVKWAICGMRRCTLTG